MKKQQLYSVYQYITSKFDSPKTNFVCIITEDRIPALKRYMKEVSIANEKELDNKFISLKHYKKLNKIIIKESDGTYTYLLRKIEINNCYGVKL